MTDVFTKLKCSELMSKIRAKNTKPEIAIRKWLHKKGYRFRLHKKDLPGKPDIVLQKYRTVVFVNGCFWHMHYGCKKNRMPKSNLDYWDNKFKKNFTRDKKNCEALKNMGWQVITIWECEIENSHFQKKLIDINNSKFISK